MDLHYALKKFYTNKGNNFFMKSHLINVLCDYNAFENHIHLKNQLRILIKDGYINQIKDLISHGQSTDSTINEICRLYGFDYNSILYICDSFKFALGVIETVNPLTSNVSKDNVEYNKNNWVNLNRKEREQYLASILHFDIEEFQNAGYKLDAFMIFSKDVKDHVENCADWDIERDLQLTYQISNKGVKPYMLCMIMMQNDNVVECECIWSHKLNFNGFERLTDEYFYCDTPLSNITKILIKGYKI